MSLEILKIKLEEATKNFRLSQTGTLIERENAKRELDLASNNYNTELDKEVKSIRLSKLS